MSIQFGALEYSKRLFAARNVQNGRGGPDGSVLTSGQLFVSGSIAGSANGVVSGPVEHIRIRECMFRPPHFRLLGVCTAVLRPSEAEMVTFAVEATLKPLPRHTTEPTLIF